ncbi:sensor histidine kinase [Hymenobacter cellulosivorans]|uniref:Sensor histidine kinase n=1 Tax=Hymenobacter cellulosivorans TaxID=2932249 RepID=A0ABY4FBX2_9BACT|nr:sensor histidine kinase [Hymenobacter cellulosivorans]UOQ53671.1 sensor histidine kinase [Hymenobacter cellulosivorans]
MQHDAADRPSRFPLLFEILIWTLYVGLYKYAQYMETAMRIHRQPGLSNFPYPQLILFALVATLYIIPYYRWLIPVLVRQQRYVVLGLVMVLYTWWGIKLNAVLAHGVFRFMAQPPILAGFYARSFTFDLAQLPTIANGYISLLFTDLLAFGCVAFVRIAFENEYRRRHLEKDHLALQLEQLKTQLQPHFLFNTLNSIYGLSLVGSPETPRFILLLSELMRYVLYDSGKDYIGLPEEVTFLENYFEMEQRKYPGASIRFEAHELPEGLQVPPLLLLPLVENSFKHGRHHFSDAASVTATLSARPGQLHFVIENDMLPAPPPASPRRSGGIGLVNIRQRLNLYYPRAHELHLTEHDGRYRAELTLTL